MPSMRVSTSQIPSSTHLVLPPLRNYPYHQKGLKTKPFVVFTLCYSSPPSPLTAKNPVKRVLRDSLNSVQIAENIIFIAALFLQPHPKCQYSGIIVLFSVYIHVRNHCFPSICIFSSLVTMLPFFAVTTAKFASVADVDFHPCPSPHLCARKKS